MRTHLCERPVGFLAHDAGVGAAAAAAATPAPGLGRLRGRRHLVLGLDHDAAELDVPLRRELLQHLCSIDRRTAPINGEDLVSYSSAGIE